MIALISYTRWNHGQTVSSILVQSIYIHVCRSLLDIIGYQYLAEVTKASNPLGACSIHPESTDSVTTGSLPCLVCSVPSVCPLGASLPLLVHNESLYWRVEGAGRGGGGVSGWRRVPPPPRPHSYYPPGITPSQADKLRS